jgi:hypothetical protein
MVELLISVPVRTGPDLELDPVLVQAVLDIQAGVALLNLGSGECPFLTGISVAVVAILHIIRVVSTPIMRRGCDELYLDLDSGTIGSTFHCYTLARGRDRRSLDEVGLSIDGGIG